MVGVYGIELSVLRKDNCCNEEQKISVDRSSADPFKNENANKDVKNRHILHAYRCNSRLNINIQGLIFVKFSEFLTNSRNSILFYRYFEKILTAHTPHEDPS